MEDISKVLAFEVKKELAERYFGFRKLIEDDTASYREQILVSAFELDTKIGCDMVQLYTCLQSSALIQQFLDLISFEEKLFYDNFVHITPNGKKEVFSCKRVQGFTRKARLRNAFYDSYQSLYNHIVEYNQNLEEFCLKHATIREQINLFYKKNDFTGMMQFLTNLDCCRDQTEKAMAPSTGSYESLEKKMRISAPPPVDQFLPEIPAIPQFRQIKNKLKSLIDESHAAHPELDPRHFCR